MDLCKISAKHLQFCFMIDLHTKFTKVVIRISEELENTNLVVYHKNFKQSDDVLNVHKDCRRKI